MIARGATWKRALAWALRLALGGLFAWAGALKLADPATFAGEIANYEILPALSNFAAASLPAIELVLGVALVVGTRPWRRGAALAIAGLMAVFTAAVSQAVARGVSIECGCFGTSSSPVTLFTVARDVLLLAAALGLLGIDREGPAGAPA